MKSPQDQLLSEAHRYDFFQLVRLLERMAAGEGPGERRGAVGGDQDPGREVVRFRVAPSLSFPAGPVVKLSRTEGAASRPQGAAGGGESQLEMLVSFLGLIGPSGALPYHYSRLLVERIRGGDLAFRDFLDVFHHRLISLFFKAWEKYRFLFSCEGSLREARQDTFTSCLFSLVGFGTPGLQDRMEVESRALLSYAGLFAESHRTASSLQRILSDYLEAPAEVEPFVGEWLVLSEEDRSRLGSPSTRESVNNRLGIDTILGGRVWDVQGEFRVRLGPLAYERYLGFLPQGDALAPARDLVRTYVGPEFDFQLLLVLSADDVRPSRLGDSGERKPLLGWTTWLCSGPCPRDAEGALFSFQ